MPGPSGPRRNRIDPWGDLHAAPARGMFTGNRGCLVDDDRSLVRHHRGNLWITCLTSFRGGRHPLDEPRRWTPLFFLDDAVALAAGHRPCARCRPGAYRAYRDAVAAARPRGPALRATELDRTLAAERLRPGRGLARRGDRLLWVSELDELPDGAVVVIDGEPRLVAGGRTLRFGFDGWGSPSPREGGAMVSVLTPPTSVAALRHGYVPRLHATAGS